MTKNQMKINHKIKIIMAQKGKYNLGKIKEIFKQIALNESIRSHEITPAEYVNLFKKLHH